MYDDVLTENFVLFQVGFFKRMVNSMLVTDVFPLVY